MIRVYTNTSYCDNLYKNNDSYIYENTQDNAKRCLLMKLYEIGNEKKIRKQKKYNTENAIQNCRFKQSSFVKN